MTLTTLKPQSLADQIEIGAALTAKQLAALLNVAPVTIYKQAAANRIPSFRIGASVRFDPYITAAWLRQR